MAKYWHVDRSGTLAVGQVITLQKFSDISPVELQQHVDGLFPEGVSRHGDKYLLNGNSNTENNDSRIELIFEYLRRASFPKKLSRFQAFFGCKTIEDVRKFKRKFGNIDSKVFEVEAERAEYVDMGMLLFNGTILAISYYAHLYWQGNSISEDPYWECLLYAPIIIGNLIV